MSSVDDLCKYFASIEERLAALQECCQRPSQRIQFGKVRIDQHNNMMRVPLAGANKARIEVFPNAHVGLGNTDPDSFIIQAPNGSEVLWIAAWG